MILSSDTKTFQNMMVLKISNKGFMDNQYSKSITKYKFELHLHLALLKDIYQKCIAMPFIFHVARKLQNPSKITLHRNRHSSAPIKAKKVPRVRFKDNGHSYAQFF